MNVIAVLLGCAIDHELGEPKKYHPLIAFGFLANKIENILNPDSRKKKDLNPNKVKLTGIVAFVLLVAPILGFTYLFAGNNLLYFVVSIFLFYLCIGGNSLRVHANKVYVALKDQDLQLARREVSNLVSRDTDELNQTEITKATIESVLENSNDAIFASIFWFMLFGIPGVLLHRLTNTLDAMWGYKTSRFLHFGWFAAKLDDVLNWIPARLTAFSFLLVARFIHKDKESAIRGAKCKQQQAQYCASPNGGVVMTTGAGVLGLKLGGPTKYHGRLVDKIEMGEGNEPQPDDIVMALKLIKFSLYIWLASSVIIGVLYALLYK